MGRETWVEYFTEEGTAYYYNPKTGVTSWTPYTDEVPQRASLVPGTDIGEPLTEEEEDEDPNMFRVAIKTLDSTPVLHPTFVDDTCSDLSQITTDTGWEVFATLSRSTTTHQDEWRFDLPHILLDQKSDSVVDLFLKRRQTQTALARWNSFFTERSEEQAARSSQATTAESALFQNVQTMKIRPETFSLLLQGIPTNLRRQVWPVLAGVRRRAEAGAFIDSLNFLSAQTSAATAHLHEDVDESVRRGHPFAQHGLSHRLRRVLRAFSVFEPRIGYCRSLAHIARYLIMNVPEEDAFWLLVAINERVLPSYHSRAVVGVQPDCLTILDLIREKMTDVFHHFEKFRVPVHFFISKWLLCAFADILPAETVFRVWDVMFCLGKDALIRVALATCYLLEDKILEANSLTDIVEVLTIGPLQLYDANQLIETADFAYMSVPENTPARLREKYWSMVTEKFMTSRFHVLATTWDSCKPTRQALIEMTATFPDFLRTLSHDDADILFKASLMPANETDARLYLAEDDGAGVDMRHVLCQLLMFCRGPIADKFIGMCQILRKANSERLTVANFAELCIELDRLVFPLNSQQRSIREYVLLLVAQAKNRQRSTDIVSREIVCEPPPVIPAHRLNPAVGNEDIDEVVCVEVLQRLFAIADAFVFEGCAAWKQSIDFYHTPANEEVVSLEISRHLSHVTTNEVITCGFLNKAGGLRGNKSWRKRFFVLTSMELVYYKSFEAKTPLNSIPSKDILDAQVLPVASAPRKHPHTLKISTKDREFFVEAPTNFELRHWHTVLSELIRSKK
eukprot:c52247_g1_i1.p1 GENE.c52247_g1_i1~~c52247_g1_i1.p1  ORF type:complete len:795 (+),score=174.81 c52247_g1_i1:51-2435(+)